MGAQCVRLCNGKNNTTNNSRHARGTSAAAHCEGFLGVHPPPHVVSSDGVCERSNQSTARRPLASMAVLFTDAPASEGAAAAGAQPSQSTSPTNPLLAAQQQQGSLHHHNTAKGKHVVDGGAVVCRRPQQQRHSTMQLDQDRCCCRKSIGGDPPHDSLTSGGSSSASASRTRDPSLEVSLAATSWGSSLSI